MIAGTIRNAVNQMQLVNDWEQKKARGCCKEARGYDCNKSGRKHDSAFPRAT